MDRCLTEQGQRSEELCGAKSCYRDDILDRTCSCPQLITCTVTGNDICEEECGDYEICETHC